jgi:hypothetical protein
MRFVRRRDRAGQETLCCPRCRELLPEGTAVCVMCGYDASAEIAAREDEVAAPSAESVVAEQ